MRVFGSLRRAIGALVVLVIGAATLQVPAAQAAPANDAFADALVLAVPGSVRMATLGASMEVGEPEPSCVYSDSDASEWFRITGAPGTGVAASSSGSNFDNALAFWSGDSLSSLEELSCNDYSTSYDSSRARAVIPASGFVYVQALNQYGESGELRLTVSAVERPAHDSLAAAQVVGSLPFSEETDLDGATLDPGEREGACYVGSDAGTVWYRLDLPQATRVRARAYGADDLNVYTGAPGALVRETCAGSRAEFSTVAGTTYWIQLADSGNGGYVTLELDEVIVPANDDFDNAAVLTMGQRVNGTLEGASIEADEPVCGPRYDDSGSVWYKFSVPVNQVVKLRSSVYYLGVYTYTPLGLTQVACTSRVPYGSLAMATTGFPVPAQGGKTYYVQASNYGSFYGNSFTLELLSTLGGI